MVVKETWVDYLKSSSSRMIGIGSCDGGDGKKTVSKSSTGRSSSNGLEGVPVSLSSYLERCCLEHWE